MWRADLHAIKKICTVFIPCGLFLILLFVFIPIQIHPLTPITSTSFVNVSVAYAGNGAAPGGWFNPVNWFNSILSTILGLFISIAAGFLSLAGVGFNAAINYTILDFSSSFAPFQDGIYAAWSAFRDLGNIILIAMFVYLAFNVILNIDTYGLKKFGVRILVVALLINFSLFFTKAIIDVSNITAITFYKSMTVVQVAPPAGSTSTTGNATTTMGIANVFMQATGLSSALDGGDVVNKIIGTKGKGGGYGPAFMYTFLVVFFFFALSGIFVFALILLITRMIAFIVLLPLSALAFAAYITPNGDQLWNKWLGSLTSNALFAPVFMALLWGVIKIIESPTSKSQQSLKLDQMLTNQGVWSAAFMMTIIIALLYAATMIAHSLSLQGSGFAKKMGMKTFSAVPRRAAGLGAGVGGTLGRSSLGHLGRNIAENKGLKQAAVHGNAFQRFGARSILNLGNKAAKAKYDARNTKAGRAASNALGGSNRGTSGISYDEHIKTEGKLLNDARKAKKAEENKGTDKKDEHSSTASPKQNAPLQTNTTTPQQTTSTPPNDKKTTDTSRETQAAIAESDAAIKAIQKNQNEHQTQNKKRGIIDVSDKSQTSRHNLPDINVNNVTTENIDVHSTHSSKESSSSDKEYLNDYVERKGQFAESRPVLGDDISSPTRIINVIRRVLNPTSAGTKSTRELIAKEAQRLSGESEDTREIKALKKRLKKIEDGSTN